MRLTQGAFSYLPDLTDEQIVAQIRYCQNNGWSVGVEYTDDPHPRNTYWEMWGQPMFGLNDPAAVMFEVQECRKVFGSSYIRVVAFDATHTWESLRLSFLVNRPAEEPGFYLDRTETQGRNIQYTLRPYGAQSKPMGERY